MKPKLVLAGAVAIEIVMAVVLFPLIDQPLLSYAGSGKRGNREVPRKADLAMLWVIVRVGGSSLSFLAVIISGIAGYTWSFQ